MNIKKIILDELKDKDYTKMEIARYIYIRLGQLLVFDPLYVYGSISVQNRLVYKFVDIENLENNKVICSTWALIYSELLDEFDIENEVRGTRHYYVLVNIDGYIFKADATEGNSMLDLGRIKYGDATQNYEAENIEEIDKKINYYKGIYLTEIIEMLKVELQDEQLLESCLGITKDMSIPQRVRIKFEFIASLLNKEATPDKNYIDAINYLYRLMDCAFNEEEALYIRENVYYKINETDTENLVIFKIDEEDEYFYFGNEEEVYRTEKIEKEKVYYYDKNYRSSRKEFYL